MQSVNSLLSGMTEPRLSELRRRLESKSVDSGCHIDTHAFFYILYDCGVIVDRWLTIQVVMSVVVFVVYARPRTRTRTRRAHTHRK